MMEMCDLLVTHASGVGTRVILSHAYFHVDQDIIDDVVKRDVPAIRDDLKTIVDSLDPD